MEQSPQHTVSAVDDASALYRAQRAPGYVRLVYVVYAMLSIIFYGVAIFTVLGMLRYFLNGGSVATLSALLFLCYILINAIVGYGFMFYRKWLVLAFACALLLTVFPVFASGMADIATRLSTISSGPYIIAGILIFLFFTRRFLSGRPVSVILVLFIGALLLSLLLTNPGMLH